MARFSKWSTSYIQKNYFVSLEYIGVGSTFFNIDSATNRIYNVELLNLDFYKIYGWHDGRSPYSDVAAIFSTIALSSVTNRLISTIVVNNVKLENIGINSNIFFYFSFYANSTIITNFTGIHLGYDFEINNGYVSESFWLTEYYTLFTN